MDKETQSKIDEQVEKGNISGMKIIEETSAPALTADFLAQKTQKEVPTYVKKQVILPVGDDEYQPFSVLVRKGETASDDIVARQIVNEEVPDRDDIDFDLKERLTAEEEAYLDARSDVRRRVNLTRFIYQVPAEDAPEDTDPVPLFFWDAGGAGMDVRSLSSVTVAIFHEAYRDVNPVGGVPAEVRDRFSDV